MKISNSLIHQFRKVCRKYPRILFAYLFGSFATQSNHPASDIDIALYLKEGLKPNESYFDLRLKLLGEFQTSMFQMVDLIILNEAFSTLCYSVIKDGIVFYERDKNARLKFESDVLTTYLDFEPFRRVQLSYLKTKYAKT